MQTHVMKMSEMQLVRARAVQVKTGSIQLQVLYSDVLQKEYANNVVFSPKPSEEMLPI